MCGILGQVVLSGQIQEDIFRKMLLSLSHRGPDHTGLKISENNRIALGHTRLSFLDLSEQGAQPMCDNNGEVWLTFNGEIYNYLELKKELSHSYSFQTETDSEVIIAAYKVWGIAFINKLKGMFAFGLYDSNIQKIFLVRDRFGIKPLYYYNSGAQLIFASELKAIMASGEVAKNINYSAFSDYFVYRYIPSPKTIWQNVNKIEPATYLEINTLSFEQKHIEYWKLHANNSLSDPILIEEINEIIKNAVKEHTRSDVPIGSFLSGGYDSSALVHYMKTLGQNPETFSIGFSNWEKSEDQFAELVAKHLSVNNTKVVADENSLQYLEIMPTVYDEPIADISIIPTFMVSKLAKTKVKAVLSGEGADEIFGGYTWQQDFMKKPNSTWFRSLFGEKIDTVSWYAEAMAMGKFDAKELKLMLHPRLHPHIEKDVFWFYRQHFLPKLSRLKSIQYLDIKCFMGELVLTKMDRASMANSLEVRVPFLDHTLFEKIFSLQESNYFKPEQTKFLLYENIKNILPKQILNRKKQGFVGPDKYYMNIDFYKKELENSALVKYEIINQAYINELLTETYNWKLWKIVVMEKWFKHWIDH